MRDVNLTKPVKKYIENLSLKQAKQLALKIQDLRINPQPQDYKKLKGCLYLRVDAREYRIIYTFNDEMLEVVLIDKRNDEAVYERMKRLL